MIERYLVLDPDGSFRWIETTRDKLAASFRAAIGCDWLENVTLPYGFCCVVDECGKIKEPQQPLNPLASLFYPGIQYGDPLVGPVVFCKIGLVDDESDWVPLEPLDLAIIELITGRSIPIFNGSD